MQKYVLLSFILLALTVGKAQNTAIFTIHFTNGEMLDLPINLSEWQRNQRLKNTQTVTYIDMTEVVQVNWEGRQYLPVQTMYHLNIDKPLASKGTLLNKVDTTLFLQLLVSGSLDLYEHLDPNGKRHYFVGDDQRTDELITYSYLVDGSTQARQEPWKGLINLYGKNCNQAALPTALKTKPLIQWATNNNRNCGELTYAYKPSRRSVPLLVEAAANIGQVAHDFNFISGGYDHTFYSLGLRLGVPLTRASSPLKVFLGGQYELGSFRFQKETQNVFIDTTVRVANLEASYARFHLDVQYHLPISSDKWEVIGSFGIGYRRQINITVDEFTQFERRRPIYELSSTRTILQADDNIYNRTAFYPRIGLGVGQQQFSLGLAITPNMRLVDKLFIVDEQISGHLWLRYRLKN